LSDFNVELKYVIEKQSLMGLERFNTYFNSLFTELLLN